jgi:hypothetical protein
VGAQGSGQGEASRHAEPTRFPASSGIKDYRVCSTLLNSQLKPTSLRVRTPKRTHRVEVLPHEDLGGGQEGGLGPALHRTQHGQERTVGGSQGIHIHHVT